MLKGKFDKSRLPSRHVTEGPSRAPHRSYYYAMGLSEAEIAQPFVGVATCWNEAAPCNIALSRQAQAVKLGVKHANGTPREFTTITVTDGIAMGHEGMRSSLASREAIADTVELTMRGHQLQAAERTWGNMQAVLWSVEAERVEVLAEVTNQYSGVAPDDPRMEPYWEMAEALDIPVGIHIGPGPPGVFHLGSEGYRARLHSALTLEPVLVRHPKLRVYIMHAGFPMIDDLLALLYAHPQVYVGVGVIVFTRPDFDGYLQRIVDEVTRSAEGRTVPVVLFTKGAGPLLEEMAATGCDALGVDWTTDLATARRYTGDRVALQGNLEPSVLLARPEVIREEVAKVLASYGRGPGHVFNLGHGIHPGVDPAHAGAMIDAVVELSPAYHEAD